MGQEVVGLGLGRVVRLDSDISGFTQKLDKKWSKKWPKNGPKSGPKMGPKWVILGYPPGGPKMAILGKLRFYHMPTCDFVIFCHFFCVKFGDFAILTTGSYLAKSGQKSWFSENARI